MPRRKAMGLVAQVSDMIQEDFFINGSLTSRSRLPADGRHLDRWP